MKGFQLIRFEVIGKLLEVEITGKEFASPVVSFQLIRFEVIGKPTSGLTGAGSQFNPTFPTNPI